MCDDINHCQAYKTKEYALSCWDDKEENEKWNKIKRAVLETQNEVITYQGNLINAFFHAHSGGKTEDICNIWGHEDLPYLKSVDGMESEEKKEEKTFTWEEVNQILQEKYIEYQKLESYSSGIVTNDFIAETNQEETENQLNEDKTSGNQMEEEKIKVLERNSSDRIAKLQISNLVLEGTEVRILFGLRSTKMEIIQDAEKVTFQTDGYGHGVGLSQEGANSMALQGANYQEIIKHYYTGVEIETQN